MFLRPLSGMELNPNFQLQYEKLEFIDIEDIL